MKYLLAILTCLTLIGAPCAVASVKIADITRIQGARTYKLTGMGLVYGLKATGDGGDFMATARPIASLLEKFSNTVSTPELKNAKNVALVMVTVTIPADGVRVGDKLDVQVASIGAAASLKGGRLFITPLTGPTPDSGFFAFAEGPVVLDNEESLLSGVVKDGCVMEVDVSATYVENGSFTLVLQNPSASWTTASSIAKIINESEEDSALAVALDPKNIRVTIPEPELASPDLFISRIQRLPVALLPTEARVVINERTGTIVMTGDVTISPVVISHRGLTITTIDPQPRPTERNPQVIQRNTVALDTTGTGTSRLEDLVSALEQLRVPAEDRIIIVKELHKTGKLHARLMVE
jgi:flagellar P-ring protein precursor FlgI